MNSGAGESQEKPSELVFHNIHEHGVEIADMWINEVEARSNGTSAYDITQVRSDHQYLRGAGHSRNILV